MQVVWHGPEADFEFHLIFNIEGINNFEFALKAYICYYLSSKSIADDMFEELKQYFIPDRDKIIKEILDFEEKMKKGDYLISPNIYGTIHEINDLEEEIDEDRTKIDKITKTISSIPMEDEELYRLNLHKRALEEIIANRQEYINNRKKYLASVELEKGE